jgi:hypothetical protein
VQDNLMAVTHQGPGGGAAEPVGGAGDEDTGHGTILPPVLCWHRTAAQAPASRVHARRIPADLHADWSVMA